MKRIGILVDESLYKCPKNFDKNYETFKQEVLAKLLSMFYVFFFLLNG